MAVGFFFSLNLDLEMKNQLNGPLSGLILLVFRWVFLTNVSSNWIYIYMAANQDSLQCTSVSCTLPMERIDECIDRQEPANEFGKSAK